MKTSVFISLVGLLLISLLTSGKAIQTSKFIPNQAEINIIYSGSDFNPKNFYQKQCTFCHNETGRIGPPMSIVKKAYLIAYPKKEEFIKKMTAFVINPTDENRLIKNNTGKYKVMPKGMFTDEIKVLKVAEYIYDNIDVKYQPKINNSNNSQKTEKLEKSKTSSLFNVKLQLKKGVNICNILNLNQVDFEFAKASINPEMAKQLNNLVTFLKENPNIKIEIRNHTDSRGSVKHNLNLSTKRANAIKRYLIGHGIKGTRIKAVGMGETQLLNHCKDNVPCSEEEHKQNRRTEIIIL